MIERVKRSIAERARHYSKLAETRALRKQLPIPNDVQVDLETLKVLASCRTYLDRSFDVLVDVGAHKAGFALPAYHVLGCKKILAFEPNPSLTPTLQDLIQGLDAEIRVKALSDQTGELTLKVHDDPSMSSLLASDEAVLKRDCSTYNIEAINEVSVPVSTLDREIESSTVAGKAFFLKLDTRVNELDVLKGGIESTALAF